MNSGGEGNGENVDTDVLPDDQAEDDEEQEAEPATHSLKGSMNLELDLPKERDDG